jgi:hypothetical protein
MPSTVHYSAGIARNKLALISQDIQEQSNGLLNVSLSFIVPLSLLNDVRGKFYVDAAPPLMPAGLTGANLLTGRLYMSDFATSIANGLATIDASYVGGSLKSRWAGYRINRTREFFTLYEIWRYQKDSIAYELVEVAGSTQNVTLNKPTRAELLSFLGYAREHYAQNQNTVSEEQKQQFATYVRGAVSESITREFLTPQVALKTITYKIED